MCPQLHGMFYVKLCLLLTLIGGSAPNTASSSSSSSFVGSKTSGEAGESSAEAGPGAGVGAAASSGGLHRRFQSHLVSSGNNLMLWRDCVSL